MMTHSQCPNCNKGQMAVFYEIESVPVHSVLLMKTRERALTYPKGDIRLALCDRCGFVSNVAFEASLHEYSEEYEATQSYSPTFNKFNRSLAQRLIDTHDLHDQTIVEIGCGNGEFLILLCELGPNRGIGFDPAYLADRIDHPVKERIRFIQDFYSEKYADEQGDFYVCKMTLEHIPDTADFLSTVRKAIGERTGTRVFFQIPNGSYVMRDVAFWDIYYEHCSYFSKASLASLFQNAGFDISAMYTDYDDQYLMIEAQAAAGIGESAFSLPALLDEVRQDVHYFGNTIDDHLRSWRTLLDELAKEQKRLVIWGSGSKAVAFISSLNISNELGYVVDINPNKWGYFMPGSGHEIVAPGFLTKYQPDVVIVMNPIYRNEISAELRQMGVTTELLTVEVPATTS